MRQLQELEQILKLLVEEHYRLLAHIEAQNVAMRTCRPELVEQATARQETSRLRIAALDTRRRGITSQISKLARITGEVTLTKLSELFPPRGAALIQLRDQLREVVEKIQSRMSILTRVTNSLLGHFNTAARVIAGAVEQAGVYTKQGVPRVSDRIGSLEAVG